MIEQIAGSLGVEKGAVLVPFSILVSSIIGAVVAIWAIKSNRKIARLKNSMDFLNSFNEADDIAGATREVANFNNLNTAAEIQQWALDNADEVARGKTAHIRTVLNYYEKMAICVHHEIYDDQIIKEGVYTTVVTIWDICLPYIEQRNRVRNEATFYQDLKILVDRWKLDPLKKK